MIYHVIVFGILYKLWKNNLFAFSKEYNQHIFWGSSTNNAHVCVWCGMYSEKCLLLILLSVLLYVLRWFIETLGYLCRKLVCFKECHIVACCNMLSCLVMKSMQTLLFYSLVFHVSVAWLVYLLNLFFKLSVWKMVFTHI